MVEFLIRILVARKKMVSSIIFQGEVLINFYCDVFGLWYYESLEGFLLRSILGGGIGYLSFERMYGFETFLEGVLELHLQYDY